MKGYRFHERTNKVTYIELGRAHELFTEIDANADGQVSKKELDTFLDASGLDGRIFGIAFKNLIAREQTVCLPEATDTNLENDGEAAVDTNKLLEEFTRVLAQERENIEEMITQKYMNSLSTDE